MLSTKPERKAGRSNRGWCDFRRLDPFARRTPETKGQLGHEIDDEGHGQTMIASMGPNDYVLLQLSGGRDGEIPTGVRTGCCGWGLDGARWRFLSGADVVAYVWIDILLSCSSQTRASSNAVRNLARFSQLKGFEVKDGTL